MMTTIEGNKLIAEFMGKDIRPGEQVVDYDYQVNCFYHTSWDWLMPVVEKIRDMGYYLLIEFYPESTRAYVVPNKNEEGSSQHRYTKDESAISVVYEIVVQFIQWFNNQKQ